MKNFHSPKKFIAILTGAFSVLIAILYLLLVFALDLRGPMTPPPIEAFGVVVTV